MSKPNFKNDLAFGASGEALIYKFYPGSTRLDGRKADFILECGSRLELKTERRTLAETGNLFIEYFSDEARMKRGGPWQARENGCKYYAHLFIKDGVLFVFEVEALLEFLEKSRYGVIRIQNSRWVSTGFKVPRADVRHLYQEKKL